VVAAGFGLLLIVSIVIAAQRRRTGAIALLLERMGLSHRSAFRALLIEVATPVTAAAVLSVLCASWAVSVVLRPLDGSGGETVPPIRRVPIGVIGLTSLSIAVAVVVASWLGHRATRHAVTVREVAGD
jgi:hypothetical protein